MLKEQLCTEHQLAPERDIIEQIRKAGLHPPQTMTLMITGGCNLFCRHCWLDCSSLDQAAPVPARHIFNLIDAFTQLGGAKINLTGGEVLSHPDWHRILAFALDHCAIEEVCLQTNATLLTREQIEALLKLRTGKLTIQVSLDGACDRTHNLVRGPGSFRFAIDGLRLLVDAGLGFQTRVAFTEMAHNIHELPELLEKIDKMGIGKLVSGTLVVGGRAATSKRIDLPMPAQYWELIDYYQSDTIFKALYDQKANIAAIEWFKNRSKSGHRNCSCLKHLFVDAQGCLYPCTMLLIDPYAMQNVYSRPLGQSIEMALAKWREIPILSRKRHRQIPSCSQCDYKHQCGGGCMGRAAVHSGDLMTPEDRCPSRKAVYRWTPLPRVASFCSRR